MPHHSNDLESLGQLCSALTDHLDRLHTQVRQLLPRKGDVPDDCMACHIDQRFVKLCRAIDSLNSADFVPDPDPDSDFPAGQNGYDADQWAFNATRLQAAITAFEQTALNRIAEK